MPEGFDLVDLPAGEFLLFRSEPFREEDYCQAIEQLWQAIEGYDPAPTGYCWDETGPRVQLEPIGERGYMELLPVRRL